VGAAIDAEAAGDGLVRVLRAAGCVFAEDEARILRERAADPEELERLVALRVDGMALEHVVGWAEFCGRRILVEPGVFVPRRRSEHLVRTVLAQLASRVGSGGRTMVVDLCCGSGAIGAVLADRIPGARIHACDIDAAAVRVARRNLPADAVVACGDLLDPLPADLRGTVDVLVGNVPYVPTEEIGLLPRDARTAEPRVAFDGGDDGLDIARRVLAAASTWLCPGGFVAMEIAEDQVDGMVSAIELAGLIPRLATERMTGTVAALGVRATPVRTASDASLVSDT